MKEQDTENLVLSRRNVLKMSTAAAAAAMAPSVLAQEHPSGGSAMQSMNVFAGTYQNGKYTLPDLPYGYDALEPFYDEQTLRIHHDKHHAGYVNGLNKTLAKIADVRQAGDYASIKALSRDLAFNGSGHILHTLFWHSMKPAGQNHEMPGELQSAFEAGFGSVDAGRAQFAAATKAVEASGWGVLAYEPVSQKLIVLQCEKHQNLTIWGVEPILVCDVWEHAYYLKYQNNRGQWVDNFMQLANWPFAAECLSRAKRMMAQM